MSDPQPPTVTVLAGGVGAAKLLAGMAKVDSVLPDSVTAIVNVGDDFELHGLMISPDLDTVVYTIAGAIDSERGWGLSDETWHAMESLSRYGGQDWFRLGDRDLGTHLFRTERRRAGASLSRVTREIADAWDVRIKVVPVTDDRLRTMITLAQTDLPEDPKQPRPLPRVVSFQEYFVQRQHAVPVAAVHFDGELNAEPAPGVLDAIAQAKTVVIAPSNPVISIGPVLAVRHIREAVAKRREDVVAISPLVGGRALKGPADRMLLELGHEPSVVGVAKLYAALAGTLVIDKADTDRAEEIEKLGLRCVVTDTIMRDPAAAATLCATVLRGR